MIYSNAIDGELLTEMLYILKDLPKLRSAFSYNFGNKFVLFPEIEKVTFAIGLMLTDLAGLDPNYSPKIMNTVQKILADYLQLLSTERNVIFK